jgi:hypothetical protein
MVRSSTSAPMRTSIGHMHLMRRCMWQRRDGAHVQGETVLDLPPVSEKEVHVELSEADRGFYNIVRPVTLLTAAALAPAQF